MFDVIFIFRKLTLQTPYREVSFFITYLYVYLFTLLDVQYNIKILSIAQVELRDFKVPTYLYRKNNLIIYY